MKKSSITQTHGFITVVCIIIFITWGVIAKQMTIETGIITGAIVIIAAPFVVWLFNAIKKHNDYIHYNNKGSHCYYDKDRIYSEY